MLKEAYANNLAGSDQRGQMSDWGRSTGVRPDRQNPYQTMEARRERAGQMADHIRQTYTPPPPIGTQDNMPSMPKAPSPFLRDLRDKEYDEAVNANQYVSQLRNARQQADVAGDFNDNPQALQQVNQSYQTQGHSPQAQQAYGNMTQGTNRAADYVQAKQTLLQRNPNLANADHRDNKEFISSLKSTYGDNYRQQMENNPQELLRHHDKYTASRATPAAPATPPQRLTYKEQYNKESPDPGLPQEGPATPAVNPSIVNIPAATTTSTQPANNFPPVKSTAFSTPVKLNIGTGGGAPAQSNINVPAPSPTNTTSAPQSIQLNKTASHEDYEQIWQGVFDQLRKEGANEDFLLGMMKEAFDLNGFVQPIANAIKPMAHAASSYLKGLSSPTDTTGELTDRHQVIPNVDNRLLGGILGAGGGLGLANLLGMDEGAGKFIFPAIGGLLGSGGLSSAMNHWKDQPGFGHNKVPMLTSAHNKAHPLVDVSPESYGHDNMGYDANGNIAAEN